MIAVLATYVIKSRQNEIVTWTGAGQSVYRLLFPAIILMLCLGIINVLVQEFIAPRSNQQQDTFRSLIRGRGKDPKAGRQWVATGNRIYGFTFDGPASDNEKRRPRNCSPACLLEEIDIYEFEPDGHRLQAVYRAESASWGADVIKFTGTAEKTVLEGNIVSIKDVSGGEVQNAENPMIDIRGKPSQLNILETIERIERSDSAVEKRSFMVALEKKYSTAILPFVIALFTAPFALSLSRKGKAVTVGFAVGLWLLFMGTTAVFEQLGNAGSIGPPAAVWGPLVLFALLGVYLMTRVKT
jgi:lipopolysaccharide export LptBFGC system permease protein LptF